MVHYYGKNGGASCSNCPDADATVNIYVGGVLAYSALFTLFEDDDVIVGNYAKQAAVVYPEQVVEFVKRHMGETSYRFKYRGREYSPEQLSSYILAKLKQDAEARLGQHVTGFLDGPSLRQHALDHRTIGNVLGQRLPWKQGALLENHDAVGTLIGQRLAWTAQQFAVEPDLARRDRMEAGDGVEQRGLSAARRPHDHAELAWRNLHRAMVDGHHVDALGIVHFSDVPNAERTARRWAAGKAVRGGVLLHSPATYSLNAIWRRIG